MQLFAQLSLLRVVFLMLFLGLEFSLHTFLGNKKAVLSAGLMLDHLGHAEAGTAVETAVVKSLAAKRSTRDVGGTLSTAEVGDWLAETVENA